MIIFEPFSGEHISAVARTAAILARSALSADGSIEGCWYFVRIAGDRPVEPVYVAMDGDGFPPRTGWLTYQ